MEISFSLSQSERNKSYVALFFIYFLFYFISLEFLFSYFLFFCYLGILNFDFITLRRLRQWILNFFLVIDLFLRCCYLRATFWGIVSLRKLSHVFICFIHSLWLLEQFEGMTIMRVVCSCVPLNRLDILHDVVKKIHWDWVIINLLSHRKLLTIFFFFFCYQILSLSNQLQSIFVCHSNFLYSLSLL